MKYKVTKAYFHKSGFITKETQETFNKEAFVISYLKNREKSSGYKDLIASGHLRTAVLVNFCKRKMDIETIPDLDTMLRMAYDNMDEFKKWITLSLKNETIFMTQREYLKSVTELKEESK